MFPAALTGARGYASCMMTHYRLLALAVALASAPAVAAAEDPAPVDAPAQASATPDRTPPESPPPQAPAAAPQPDQGTARQAPPGQWVYTEQYGWVFMPYADAYTYVPPDAGGEPSMYVYYPAAGWTWVAAPWVWGWGPGPFFGAYGPWRFGWYRHGPWPYAGHRWGPAPFRGGSAGYGFVGHGGFIGRGGLGTRPGGSHSVGHGQGGASHGVGRVGGGGGHGHR